MLPSASVLASRREERVQKAVSVVHHGPGDARLSGVLNPLSHAECDYVADADADAADADAAVADADADAPPDADAEPPSPPPPPRSPTPLSPF